MATEFRDFAFGKRGIPSLRTLLIVMGLAVAAVVAVQWVYHQKVVAPREAARTRLEALGYADPAGALRHLEALTAGVSRRASIQRTLLPVMLGWFADGPDPDAGLLGFRQVSDALGTTPWYLRLLRDDVSVAERMAHVLASSRYATDLLLRAPEAVALLRGESDLAPRPEEALRAEALAAVRRHLEPGKRQDAAADAVVTTRPPRALQAAAPSSSVASPFRTFFAATLAISACR